MIMHGTWYKGPQLTHHPHTDYHQFRSYPSFVVTPYHDGHATIPCPPPTSCSSNSHAIGPGQTHESAAIIVEGSLAAAATAVGSETGSSVLNSPIKIEQVFGEPATGISTAGTIVDDYALSLDCSVEHHFRTQSSYSSNSIKSPPETTAQQQQQQQQQQQSTGKSHDSSSSTTAAAVAAAAAAAAAVNMPIGSVQGQNPTQGLVHWMSAVMAEHMTGQTHHDPSTAVGMHYMWNGNVDHAKDISDYNLWPPTPRSHQHASEHHPMTLKQEYEAKMNDHHHHNNLQKGSLGLGGVPNGAGSAAGSNSALGGSTHHSNHVTAAAAAAAAHHHNNAVAAASAAALLVVPQPINAIKMSGSGNGVGAAAGHGHAAGGGSGRKYQCKMCPQVSRMSINNLLLLFA
ncbi:rn [Drosophila busckii]|uniref:Rn n=1 Tax=Drosophila busckii TaxID=30019 RepID=A0A0M4EGM1_DROBS|nr:rn [Drosophila busckii]